MQELTLTRPDDWHLHFRDGDKLPRTVADTARVFRRAVVMPNLVPPVTTAAQALDYKARIDANVPAGTDFQPLMTLYLTDNTNIIDIEAAAKDASICGCKLYPAGATTNSDSGVTDIKNIYPVLEAMQKHDLPLQIHGEVTSEDIDIFDREKCFIDRTLNDVCKDFPELRIIFEHITTKDAVEFVEAANDNVAATITVHHLLFNRNDMLVGGIRPHYYCLPVLKRNIHQQALIAAATSGNPSFFLGTDSAPHSTGSKESSCGCAGCYTACAAIELYATAFEQADALDKLEGFASFYGADFYQLSRNNDTITLTKQNWQIPQVLLFGDEQVKPLLGGETLHWKVQS